MALLSAYIPGSVPAPAPPAAASSTSPSESFKRKVLFAADDVVGRATAGDGSGFGSGYASSRKERRTTNMQPSPRVTPRFGAGQQPPQPPRSGSGSPATAASHHPVFLSTTPPHRARGVGPDPILAPGQSAFHIPGLEEPEQPQQPPTSVTGTLSTASRSNSADSASSNEHTRFAFTRSPVRAAVTAKHSSSPLSLALARSSSRSASPPPPHPTLSLGGSRNISTPARNSPRNGADSHMRWHVEATTPKYNIRKLGRSDSFASSSAPGSPSVSNTFGHQRCLNCDSQFVVCLKADGERPPSVLGEFCSGECRCSYIASGVEARAREDSRMHMIYSDFSDSSDDEDDHMED